jgi:hypothetical protein
VLQENSDQKFQMDRLCDHILCARFHSAHRNRRIAVGAEYDRPALRLMLRESLQNLEPRSGAEFQFSHGM